MKKIILSIGALVALSSFSVYELLTPVIPLTRSASADSSVGTTDGLVFPTNVAPCIPGSPRPVDPPLPKSVSRATWYNTDWPPLRYQKNNRVVVIFETPEQIQTDETHGKPCQGTFFAYQEGNRLHLPNPCKYPKSDRYAELVCHELGHYNGWPGYHGD